MEVSSGNSGSVPDIETAILAACVAALSTVAAGLTPEPASRSWRDQTAHAVYPALLAHVAPSVPDPENTALDAVLWTGMVNFAATSHVETTPPATGTTPVAADPDGAWCREAIAAVRAAILAGFPAVSGMTLLNAFIDSADDAGDGPVNMQTFRVTLKMQIGG